RNLGSLALISDRSGPHAGAADARFAHDFARRLALAVLNGQLYRATLRSEREARARADELARLGAEMRQSEARLRALTESLVEAVYETDVRAAEPPTGRYRYWSDNVASVLGYSAAEWLRDDTLWERTIHPEDRERVRAAWRELRARGDALDVEYRVVKPTGEIAWIEDRARLERGPDGEPLLARGTRADVSARKRLEQQLLDSEREARALYQAALAVGGEQELQAQLERLLEAARELVGAQRAAVALVDPERDEVQTVAARGLSPRASHLRLPRQGSLLGLVVDSAQPVRTGDAPNDPRTWMPEQLREEGVASWLG